MVKLSTHFIRVLLAVVLAADVVTLVAMILASAMNADYFGISGAESSIVKNNVHTYNMSVFSMASLNLIIRFVLPIFYFIGILLTTIIWFRSITYSYRLRRRDYRNLLLFLLLWHLITCVLHVSTISSAIDIMRVFINQPNPGMFRDVLTPWTGSFPWHLVVLLALASSVVAIVSLIAIAQHYHYYHATGRIHNAILETIPNARVPGEYQVVAGKSNARREFRVVKIEGDADINSDGKVQVLLEDDGRGKFEIITEEELDEMKIRRAKRRTKKEVTISTPRSPVQLNDFSSL